METKDNEKSLFEGFSEITIAELEKKISASKSREETIFYRNMLNLKLQLAQEKIVGERLL